MKRFSLLAILAVLALLVCCILPTHAEAATYGYYTYSVFDGEATIKDCGTSISGNITIPSTLGGYPVTSIGYNAFYGCRSLTSITIPDSVTNIDSYAFEGCSSLTSVTIGNGVTRIGGAAFYNCSNLTSITIPASVTSIGSWAFFGCSSLTSITIPNSVTSIAIRAFSDCSSLTNITIPNSVTSIGNYAFSDCSSLISVTIGNSVTSIGAGAFYKCSSLTSIAIPDSVTSIGSSAFYKCSSLTSIAIPDSVTSIGSSAFYECSSLTSITIPNSVTSIGGQAFKGCRSLTSITIPDSVTSIEGSAFYKCSSLTSIWVDEKNSAYSSNDQGVLFNKNKTTLLHVPGGISGFYTTPNSVTSIGEYAFSGGGNLTSITIPNSVTSIGDYAFRYCSSLASITIPNSVTTIGNSTFEGCSSLTSITIPDSVTTIGDYAFRDCNRLNHVAYTGTENQWNSISIKSYNSTLTNATRHYETALQTTEDCVAINIYCPACQKFVTSIAKPNGFHAFSAATCTAPKTCTACGVTDGAALGHSFEDDSCTVCGKKTVDLKITAVTLRPEAAGLYFTGSFEIAENVSVVRQGIVVSVYSSMPVADGSDPNSLWSAGTTSVMVKNILRANLKDTSNQNRAAMPIYARAYVELEDGTYVYSDVSAVNLQEVVEAADGQWNTLDAIQKEAFLAMYKKFQEILQAWSIPNVKKV